MPYPIGGRIPYTNYKTLRQEWLLGPSASQHVMDELMAAVSNWIDGYCRLSFIPWYAEHHFDPPPAGNHIPLNGLVAYVSSSSAAGVTPPNPPLSPYNVRTTGDGIAPFTGITIPGNLGTNPASIHVTGLWSEGGRLELLPYHCITGDSGLPGSVSQLTLTSESGTAIRVAADISEGDVLLLGESAPNNFQDIALVIEVKPDGIITVVRRLNGSAAVSAPMTTSRHQLRQFHVDPAVTLACAIQCARIYRRGPNFEPYYVDSDVDTDVYLLLEPFRAK